MMSYSNPESLTPKPDTSSSVGQGDELAFEQSDDELIQMLGSAERQVQQLKAELERRRNQQVRAQHDEADNFAEHLENAQINWQRVREFFASAISEFRAKADTDSESSQQTDAQYEPNETKEQP